MQSTRTARLFVGLNAAFSAVTGLCLLVFTDEVQPLLFRDSAWWQIELLTVLGVGLVGFSLFLLMLVTDRFVTRFWVNLVVLADIGWILMTGLVVITTGGIFNSTGLLTVGIVALVVAVFAAGQFVGARRIVD